MYDTPVTPLDVVAWALAGLALLLAVVRAVRVEYRAAVARGGPRPAGHIDGALDATLGLALAGLVGVLVTIVWAGLG
ncbi:hypothetical protein [Actinomycetospora chiangmaiensis]|uniref:hypothetical protein n=1 Tax=Actinomycetospora chiangmaiensis TaxID=402650 RepID=UPI00036BB094|nr:hypothetical protein [Actinomycetospora chiangmaiensis]